MDNNDRFEEIRKNTLENYNSKLENLKELKEKLLESKKNNDIRKIEFYTKRIESVLSNINNIKATLDCMRLNDENDLKERKNIKNTYSKKINDVIPDDIPIVFHGNNNIEIVKQIISTKGLYTPEERGVDFKSFATQIDVTAKSNIRVSLEFADASINSFMPYGALFVFYPKEYEYDKVLKTGDSSEVFGGVESIRFDEKRFVGIITTEENITSLKRCMKENELDSNKVFTHTQFIDFCKENFKSNTKLNK